MQIDFFVPSSLTFKKQEVKMIKEGNMQNDRPNRGKNLKVSFRKNKVKPMNRPFKKSSNSTNMKPILIKDSAIIIAKKNIFCKKEFINILKF